MKVKILCFCYSDSSGYKNVRVYLEKDFDQAEKDLTLMNEHASDCKKWKLDEIEVFGVK